MDEVRWMKTTGPQLTTPEDVIRKVLSSARQQLGMDVSFIAEASAERRLFRYVSGQTEAFGIRSGGSDPLSESYCALVLSGDGLAVTDAKTDPRTRDLAITSSQGIGCYAGVPVQFSDGRVYGTMCTLSKEGKQVTDADLRVLRLLVDLIKEPLEMLEGREQSMVTKRSSIEGILAGDGLQIALQPIVDLRTRTPAGYEALSRFSSESPRPDMVFADAHSVGLGIELELFAIEKALRLFESVDNTKYISVNLSPATADEARFQDLIATVPAERLVLEVTEHSAVDNYSLLNAALSHPRSRGTRLAVDDVGAGFASLSHILKLSPDILKLDRGLTMNVDTDLAEQALVGAMVSFAGRINAIALAEGTETTQAADALRVLGVNYGQGYLFGRPEIVSADDEREYSVQ
ncbi:MAG: EAL domain-containing protein [Actinobacteria bacterium]|nr:EAL domain-containing protein [Actinomycetota bacterium]